MSVTTLSEIVPVLQMAIGPVILISGVGLLLLTMTNRLGRTIDRARQLVGEIPKRNEKERYPLLAQVAIIYRRARLLRVTITLAVLSVFLTASLIILLFLTALFHWENAVIISGIFITGMSSLIISLIPFMYEIHLSLVALRLELKQTIPDLG